MTTTMNPSQVRQAPAPNRAHDRSRRLAAGPALDDGELVHRCRAGDQAAWSELVRRYARRLHGVAYRETLDHGAAEDVVQTTWRNLYSSLHHIDRADAIGGWLCITTRREAIRASQRSRRAPCIVERDIDDSAIDEHIVGNAEITSIRNALAQLSASDRLLLSLLFSRTDVSYAQIAHITRRPLGSIGPSRARALRRLAKLLSDQA